MADAVAPPQLDVDMLHVRLGERISALRPLVVADVTRLFLEISSLPCEQMLWSLEFAFDEDDGRIARLEARFAKRSEPLRVFDDRDGYEVLLYLPRVFPAAAPLEEARAGTQAMVDEAAASTLSARFVRALTELGAYRTIEKLELGSAEVYLL